VEQDQPTAPTSTPQEDASIQPSSSLPTQDPSRAKRYSPNHDFYNECYSFSPLIYTFVVVVFILGLKYIVFHFQPTQVSQFISLPYYYFAVLVSVVFCRHRPASRTTRVTVWTCCFAYYGVLSGYGTVSPNFGDSLEYISSTSVAVTIFAEWKLWRANNASN
jgi:hypothetical protein